MIDKEKVIAMYLAGESVVFISKHFGVLPSIILEILREDGCEPQSFSDGA